jgi:tetratricopeptide (TPR) repeat protein
MFIETAHDLEALGIAIFFEGRFSDAEPLLLRAVEIQRELSGQKSGKLGTALNNLGLLYFQMGKYTKAMDAWTSALTIDESIFGPNHAHVAAILNNLGRVELLTNHLDRAEVHMSRALEILRSSLSQGHDDLVPPLNSLGMIYLAQGNLESAQSALTEALAIARARNHRFLDQVLGNEADLEACNGNWREAQVTLREARSLQETMYGASLKGSEAWRAAVLDGVEANIEQQSGNREQAARRLSAALPLLQKRFGDDSLYVTRDRRLLGQIDAEDVHLKGVR